MIKKCILLGLACIFSTISVAQEKAEVTLYEYGRPLTNCDANFENLFANFHKYIDDRGIAVRFLSYEKTGVVRELRNRQKFTKPSVVARERKLKAIYIQQLQTKAENNAM